MGTIRKIGNDYYIEFYARGLRYQRNGGTNKEDAKRLLKDIEDQIQKGEMSIVVHDVETGVFFKELSQQLRNEHSPKTFSRYVSVIEHFQKFCHTILSSDSKLSQVTPSVFEEYRAFLVTGSTDRPAAKPKVVNLTLHLLKDILDYGIKSGHINDNPTFHTRFDKVLHRKLPRTLTSDDTGKLLKHSSPGIRDIAVLFLKTGMYRDELSGLKWDHVDFQSNCLNIESPTEILEKRKIPMEGAVMEIFQRLYKENRSDNFIFSGQSSLRFNKEQFAKDCRKILGESGVKPSGIFHIFRHTFAKDMLHKGVSLAGLYKLLGLNDIAKVMRYEGFITK